MTIKIRPSSGNVFRDLGFSREESENLKIRSNLMMRLSRLIEARKLTQAQAATLFGVTQPRVSDLVRGKIDRFGIAGRPPLTVSCGSGTRPGGTSPRA